MHPPRSRCFRICTFGSQCFGALFTSHVSLWRDKTRSVNSFRGSAKHRFAVNAKTTTRGPDTSAPQSLFSHFCKRKNNNPRSGYIRPAVVVFAFMPSAFALPSPCRYFLTLGASIMFIFLPSSFGIISTLANSSRSVAKRSSRISPCSLKTIERPRKKT